MNLGADPAKPLPQVYRMTPHVAAKVPYRFLDLVNTLRSAKGLPPLTFNVQPTPPPRRIRATCRLAEPPLGLRSDGSSPMVRVQRVGYLAAWSARISPRCHQTSLQTRPPAWPSPTPAPSSWSRRPANWVLRGSREENGKDWWTMVTGA